MDNKEKNQNAVALGKLGGKKLAKERGPEYYAEIQAKRKNRKGGRPKNPPKATHKGLLTLGTVEIPCFVLEDGTRVLSQRGLQTSVGISTSGGTGGAHRTAKIVEAIEDKLEIENDLSVRMYDPIGFMPPIGGMSAHGYEATTLIDLCELLLQARDKDRLLPMQQKYAVAADIVIRAFAKVGIIAVIDEATGYQDVRARQALAKILDQFLAKEQSKWAKKFPDEYYKELFRLRKWSYYPFSVKRPPLVGKLTIDIVYDRLAPGVRKELEQLNPKDSRGRRKNRHHQWLTPDIGHPKLQEHITQVVTLMKASVTWDEFKKLIKRALPKYPDMPLLEQARKFEEGEG